MKFGNVKDLVGSIVGGALNPSTLLLGLPGILASLFGGGNVKDNLLKQVRKRADAQEARTAGRELGFATHKIISAVAQSTPAEKRQEATEAIARAVALQYIEAAEEAIKFAPLALAREATRGQDNEAERQALAAREAGEERLIQQAIDIGRVCNGDSPKLSGGA